MELNRSVCLAYPDREVPWFHEQYCKERTVLSKEDGKLARSPRRAFIETYPLGFMFTAKPRLLAFKENVLHYLRNVIPVNEAIDVNYVSPYNHKIGKVKV